MVITRSKCKILSKKCHVLKSDIPRPNKRITYKETVMDFVKKLNDLDLSNNPCENWEDFKDNFIIFLAAADLDKASDEKKVAVFLNQIGESARKIFKTFELSESDAKVFNKVTGAFDKYCASKLNTLYERFMFYNRRQEIGEPFEDFLLDLRKLVKPCKFKDETEMLRDRIVFGINDAKLKDKLIKTEDLDYEKAVIMIRLAEKNTTREKTDQKILEIKTNSGRGKGYTNYSGSQQYRQNNRRKNNYSERQRRGNKLQQTGHLQPKMNGSTTVKYCGYCGSSHKKGHCPAYGQICSTATTKTILRWFVKTISKSEVSM